jgi:hypothetical protein
MRAYRLFLFIVVCHLIWFMVGVFHKHYYNGDSYEYIYLAERMLEGKYYSGSPFYIFDESKLSLRTPVYALFLIPFYWAAGYNILFLIFVQNLISIYVCWSGYRLLRSIADVQHSQVLYALFLCLYPAQFLFANMVVPDGLLQLFLLLYVKSAITYWKLRSPSQWVWMSVWLILAVLTKPVVYPLLYLHFVVALVLAIRGSGWRLALFASLPLCVMWAYGAWNASRTGFYHISSVQSVNLLQYNVRSYLAAKQGTEFADSFLAAERTKLSAMPALKEQYTYSSQRAASIIQQDIPGYMWFHFRESVRFFVEPGKAEIDLYTGYLGYTFRNPDNFYARLRSEGWRGGWEYLKNYPLFPLLLLIVAGNVLRITGLLLFIANRRFSPVVRSVVVLFILYFAVITGPVANTRYFLPVLPVMSACAALGLAAWMASWRARSQMKQTI